MLLTVGANICITTCSCVCERIKKSPLIYFLCHFILIGASTPTPIVPLQGQGLPHPSPLSDTDRKENRFWTDDEHQRFLEGLRLYTENNKPDLKAIASHVGSRTVPQVRSHHQKYLLKQQRHASSPKPSK